MLLCVNILANMKLLFTSLLTLCICYTAFSQQPKGTLFKNNRIIETNNPNTFNPDWAPFYHGVASGDPMEDRVIIWTRITLDTITTAELPVNWRIGTDPLLTNIVNSGTFITNADRDWTVKVDVSGLEAGTTYYYGFSYDGMASLTGKTKTTPTNDSAEHLRFGVVSCSNFQAGYFNAYGRLADRNDLDAVIHLGDYIYEYADGQYGDQELITARPVEPATEILSDADYRIRYSTYRLDTNLIRVHQQHPFISVWDDHESANDAYKDGAENHDELTEGSWEDRKSAAKKVYFEWMPIRDQNENKVYRSISYGNLMDLIMLDTRLEGREEQINDVTSVALNDPARTILGAEQNQWFKNQLSNSAAKWKIVGQQVIFAEFNVGWAALLDPSLSFQDYESLFLDIWDGYPAERNDLINYIDTNNINNVVMLTGDFHSTFAFDVPSSPTNLTFQDIPGVGTIPFYLSSDYDPTNGNGSSLVEFATPSITSANFDENLDDVTALGFQLQINNPIDAGGINLGNPNPHLKGVDLVQHGYFLLDVQDDKVQADWYFSNITEPSVEENFGFGWYTEDQQNHLVSGVESPGKTEQDEPAPENPPVLTSIADKKNTNLALLHVSPNPFMDSTVIHYAIRSKTKVQISVVDQNGTSTEVLMDKELPAGQYTFKADLSGLKAGMYTLSIRTNNQVKSTKLIKAN